MIYCDRCHQTKHDAEIDIAFAISRGCYDVTAGYWSRFARVDRSTRTLEKVICDSCMFDDPLYVQEYGLHR